MRGVACQLGYNRLISNKNKTSEIIILLKTPPSQKKTKKQKTKVTKKKKCPKNMPVLCFTIFVEHIIVAHDYT